MSRFNPNRFFWFFFRDAARPIELMSGLNLIAWFFAIKATPEMLDRDSYASFAVAPSWAWAALFGSVGLLQVLATFGNQRWRSELRQISMILATFCWALVSISFIATGVNTTAPATYLLITLLCLISGGYLAWKGS